MVKVNELLGNKNLIKILYFLIDTEEELSQTKIKNKIRISKATLIKWLNYLEKNDFVSVKIEGVSKLYKLNKDNVILKQFKILNNIAKISELDNLKKGNNLKIYLYGSCARGEDSKESDIDLLIIGNIKRHDIIDEINRLSKKLNKKITIQIFNELEWANMEKKDKAFYERVEKDKIGI